MKHLLLSIFLYAASMASAASDNHDWSFFSAHQSQTSAWNIGQGTAKVDISGGTITIEIHEILTDIVSGKAMLMAEPTATITGTISKDGRISATHAIHNSDSDAVPITGKMYRGKSTQSIIFSDGFQIYGFAKETL